MKKLAAVALLAVVALGLVGCSQIDTGRVHDKSYSAPYAYTVYDCYARDSKTSACTYSVPRIVRVPATYRFDLYRSEDEHGWHQVDEKTYHSYSIGDYYNEGADE